MTDSDDPPEDGGDTDENSPIETEDADEEMVRTTVLSPKSLHEAAKEHLEHGGISEVFREALQRAVYGRELSFRSRLERRREDKQEEIRTLRNERRQVEADIEAAENSLQAIDSKLSTLSSREDKYEAKLEELEARIRGDGVHIFPESGPVKRAATTGDVEKIKVIQDLKDRNPDVPDFVFEDAYGNPGSREWDGVPEAEINTPVDQREATYR